MAIDPLGLEEDPFECEPTQVLVLILVEVFARELVKKIFEVIGDALGFRAVLEVILSEYILDAVFLLLILCSSILMLSYKLELLFSQSTVVASSSELSRVITSVIFIFFEESEDLFLLSAFDWLDPDILVS